MLTLSSLLPVKTLMHLESKDTSMYASIKNFKKGAGIDLVATATKSKETRNTEDSDK